MEQNPTLNTSIRAVLIAAGSIGVAKGWWSETGLETVVDQLIVFGGAAMAIGATAWGIYAKWPKSTEAKVIAEKVIETERL